jgi:hypothetical protein
MAFYLFLLIPETPDLASKLETIPHSSVVEGSKEQSDFSR